MVHAIVLQFLAAGRCVAATTRTLLKSVRDFKVNTRRKVRLLVVIAIGFLLVPVAFRNCALGPWRRGIIEPSSANPIFVAPSAFQLSSDKPNFTNTNSAENSSVDQRVATKKGANKRIFKPSLAGSNSTDDVHRKVTPYQMDSKKPGGVELHSTTTTSVTQISREEKFRKHTSPKLPSNVLVTVTPNASAKIMTASDTPTKPLGWKVKCACGSSLRVLYYVHTAPDHAERRRLLRNTIGSADVSAFVSSSLVFFVGTTPDRQLRERLHAEAEKEGDVVELDFIDTYRNLTHKFIEATKWLLANDCLNSSERVVVKLDDDVMVNVFLLSSYVEYLLALDHATSPCIHCAALWNQGPIRWKNYKWFVSRQEYPSNKYPPYCVGAAFMMHASVLALLGRTMHRVPFFWVDDVYATGLVARLAQVSLVDIGRHCNIVPSKGTVAISKNTLFIHMGNDQVLFKRAEELWKSVMAQNQTV